MVENGRKLKYCVYCGAKTEGQIYCPTCGKLVLTIKPGEKKIEPKISEIKISKPVSIERVCSGCGSIITSTILEQCPICNTRLESIPDYKSSARIKPGFVFKDKKLRSEQELMIKKDAWNLKEGLNVFMNSIIVYVFIQLFLFILIWFQLGLFQSTSEINIDLILLSQIPGIAIGIYPLWYIYSNKHNSEKLGFTSDSKKIVLAIFIGIAGGILLLAINYLAGLINSFLNEVGFVFFDISEYIEQESKAIREADLIWIILLIVLISLQAISTEIVFRGVLHNTLKERFENKNLSGKMEVIIIVAFVYAALYILFSFLIGIIFFILNFLIFLILGILYEINKNIYNTIIASVFYFNLVIILMVFF
ncbi:MAG: type II CAAX prenyl endopeptidase Rce1 family protein [Candidatus Thorarchaeota archaeon]